MSKEHFVVKGHPLGFDFAEIADKNVGTEFEMDMDPHVRDLLVSTGAIEVVAKQSARKSEPSKAEAKKEPEPTAKSAQKADKIEREEVPATLGAKAAEKASVREEAKTGDAGKSSASNRK